MSEEKFIENIQAHPQDPDCKLVYADWLEEQGDRRAEYLRLEHAVATESLFELRYWDLKAQCYLMRFEVDAKWRARVGYDHVYRPMFGKLPDKRMERWRLMIRFYDMWNFPLNIDAGNSLHDITTAEEKLGMLLPGAMREFFLLAGRKVSCWAAVYTIDAWRFLSVGEVSRLSDDVLVFAEAGQMFSTGKLVYKGGTVWRPLSVADNWMPYGDSFCNFMIRQLMIGNMAYAPVVLVGSCKLGEVPVWLGSCQRANFNLGQESQPVDVYEGEGYYVLVHGPICWIVSQNYTAIRHLPLQDFDPLERTVVLQQELPD